MSYESDGTRSGQHPEYTYEWHQSPRIIVTIVSVCLTVVAAAAALVALGQLSQGVPGEAATALLVCVILAVFAVLGLCLAGFRYVGLSGRITFDAEGLRIPASRFPLIMVLLLGLMALIPGLPVLYAGLMVVSMVALLVVREKHDVTVSPDGVRRRVRQRRRLRTRRIDTFVPWDDIIAIEADVQVVTGRMTVRNPLIRIRTSSRRSGEEQDRHDTESTVVIQASQLVSEPNALMALIRHLAANPDSRDMVRQAGARELLRPPSLRERFRAARRAEKSKIYV